MKAEAGKTYAQVENNKCHWIFTAIDMPEWCEDLLVIDITGLSVSVGDIYDEITETFISPDPSSDGIRDRMWHAIRSERDRRTEQGGYKVGIHWYHSDAKSRSQQQDNEAMGGSLAPVQWKTMSGDFVTMTPALAAQIRMARMASDRAIFAAAEDHRAAMEASTDPASYDFSAGWPLTYDEAIAQGAG